MRLKKRNRGFSLIELLIVVAIIGIIAAIAIPNLLNAIQRAKQKRTMADMRSIGEAIETYQVDMNIYPQSDTISQLRTVLEQDQYMKKVPTLDGWGTELKYEKGTQNYTLQSFGKDKIENDCTGPQQRFDADIIFSSGQFTCWPEGVQKE